MTIGLISLLAACAQSPEDVAKEFTQKTMDGDAEAAIKMIYFQDAPPAQVELVSSKLKVLIVESAKMVKDEKGGVDKISTESAVYSDDKQSATVKVHITFKKGDPDVNNLHLIHTEDGWKVKPR